MTGTIEQKKTTKKLSVTENQKNQQMHSNSVKFIELGGSNKQNFPLNTRTFLKNGINNFEHLHLPQTVRQERNNNVNISG